MIILNSVIPNILIAVNAYFLYRLITRFTAARKHILCAVITAPLIFSVAWVVIYPDDVVNVLAVFIVFILMMCFLFQGSLIQKLSVVLILYPVIISVNLLGEDIGLRLWLIFGKGAYLNGILRSSLLFIRVLFWAAVYKVFGRHVENCGALLTGRMWAVIDIICLAPLSAMVSFILFTPDKVPRIYPASFACVITSLGCVYLTGYIAETVKTNLENQNLKLQKDYYRELEKNQRDIRKIRHDITNHLSVTAALIERGDKERARAYFENLSGQFAVSSRAFCGNSIVNAVINSKYNLITANGIDCFFNIDIDDMLAIDDISLCSIFANTLDNAIEASLQIQDAAKRKISVKARYHKGCFSFEAANAKESPVQKAKGAFLTGKTDKKAHGFGLSNIKNIVARYNGALDISYGADSFSVIIFIGNV